MRRITVFYRRVTDLAPGVGEYCVGMGGYVIFSSEIADFEKGLAAIPEEAKEEWLKERLARNRRISADASARESEVYKEKSSGKSDYGQKVTQMIKAHGWDENVLMRIPRYVKIKKGKIKTITGSFYLL
jgi:hypothetical protein